MMVTHNSPDSLDDIRHSFADAEEPRYSVNAMHRPSNGFDGPTAVDYWRVFDNQTQMRANGTAKYQDRAQAQAWCDHLNRTA